MQPSPPMASVDFKCCVYVPQSRCHKLCLDQNSLVFQCTLLNQIFLNSWFIFQPTRSAARSDYEHSTVQSPRDKSAFMRTHKAWTWRPDARYAGKLRLKVEKKKVLAGDETPPNPRGFNLAASSSARFALTTGTADATFAQAGKRARPVMYG